MPCPKCRCHVLWDDGQWWGCHKCSYFGQEQNAYDPQDIFVEHDHPAAIAVCPPRIDEKLLDKMHEDEQEAIDAEEREHDEAFIKVLMDAFESLPRYANSRVWLPTREELIRVQSQIESNFDCDYVKSKFAARR